ncbi:hypothetical protein TRIUR3_21827 [Triticum urartu]|uniref:Uncharacterized protein n=1 Tax=Triticum urartu TaxID=4572 RepID=M7Z765_TRIUA|nr:hypothetical protein TRIUR3_21827 [Triticum urartu]
MAGSRWRGSAGLGFRCGKGGEKVHRGGWQWHAATGEAHEDLLPSEQLATKAGQGAVRARGMAGVARWLRTYTVEGVAGARSSDRGAKAARSCGREGRAASSKGVEEEGGQGVVILWPAGGRGLGTTPDRVEGESKESGRGEGIESTPWHRCVGDDVGGRWGSRG